MLISTSVESIIQTYQFNSAGTEWVYNGSCVGDSRYQSAGCSFINGRKREVDGDAMECWGPDLLTLDDGQVYRLTDVQKDLVNEMVRSR